MVATTSYGARDGQKQTRSRDRLLGGARGMAPGRAPYRLPGMR